MTRSKPSVGLARRTFLGRILQISMTGIAAVALPQTLARVESSTAPTDGRAGSPGRLLRGTSDGLILESLDAGGSWQQVANFGKHCSVWGIREHEGQIYARIGVGERPFVLRSTDARLWRTM